MGIHAGDTFHAEALGRVKGEIPAYFAHARSNFAPYPRGAISAGADLQPDFIRVDDLSTAERVALAEGDVHARVSAIVEPAPDFGNLGFLHRAVMEHVADDHRQSTGRVGP